MLQSDLLGGGGRPLQGKAGPLAINVNDLLEINSVGYLSTVAVSDYAAVANIGSAVVASTTVTSYYQNSTNGRNLFINPADLSIFTATAYLASDYGLEIFKYSSLGGLLAATILDTASYIPCAVSIAQLSNGNLAIVWGERSNATICFAITDINLNVIVAKTTITAAASYDNSNNLFIDAISLSGGGFAVAWAGASNVNLNIYSNTGTSVYSGAISGSPGSTSGTNMAGPRLAQLSSGNIACAITSTVASEALGHAIVTAAGASVLAYTVLDSASISTGPTVVYPEINVLGAYYCTAIADGTNAKGYVLSNAGALQGAAYSATYTFTSSTFKVTNDGTNFWAWFASGSASTSIIAMLPTSGSGYVSNTDSAVGGLVSMFYDHGLLVSNLGVRNLASSGASTFIASGSTAGISSVTTMRPGGDFTAVWTNTSSTTTIGVVKYLNTAIAGVSQATVAAGNAGTLVPYMHGGGAGKNGYQINAVAGSVGKSFNHSATNIVGNTGTILGNSVALEGII